MDKHRVVKQLEEGHHVPSITREVGQDLVVEASSGIIVIWDKKTTIFIKLDPSYKVGHQDASCALGCPQPRPHGCCRLFPQDLLKLETLVFLSAGHCMWSVWEL